MIALLLTSKCPEACKVVLENSTNQYDMEIVKTICYYSTIIALIVAITIIGVAIINKRKWKNENASSEETKTEESSSEEEMQKFLDFCFEMTKSKKDDNKELAKECWTILKDKYVAKNDDNISLNNNEE